MGFIWNKNLQKQSILLTQNGTFMHRPTSKAALRWRHFKASVHNDWNKVENFAKKVEHIGSGFIHNIYDFGKGIVLKGENLANTALDSETSLVKGIGGIGGSFKYLPYILAGLVGLVILNADKVGQGVQSVRRAAVV